MTEPKLTEETPRSPYELWPDETAPFNAVQNESAFAASEPPPYDNPFGVPVEKEGDVKFDAPFEAPFVPVAYTPETTEQTVRNNGLAFSIGVVFVVSVIFMMFVGWGADLLLGSSPYGLVAGIVLGSIIGFIQFFRISSQMFATTKPDPDHRPLLTRNDDE
ncbi:MAG: AtpZ/AtpI family protein [Pyrinomonadaceae bacterium]